MKKIYAIEVGQLEVQAATGLLVFQNPTLSSEAYEDINDAIAWIQSRYNRPVRIGDKFIWQSASTDYAYRIRFLDVKEKGDN